MTGKRLGLSITEEQFYGFAGQSMPDIIEQRHQLAGKGEAPVGFVDQFLTLKLEGMAVTYPEGFHPAKIECVVSLMKGYIARVRNFGNCVFARDSMGG